VLKWIEFVVIFRAVPVADATTSITTIRHDLEAQTLKFNGESLQVTVSFGISQLQPEDLTFTSWFTRVDQYLYQSKKAGRDRITVEGKTITTN